MKLRHLLNIVKRHAKYPLTNISHEWCEGGEPHYHICYAARLLGSDLPKVCPHCTNDGFEPEHENVCDFCKYFGIIDITEHGLILNADSRVTKLQEPAIWINITSDKAALYRGWGYSSVPVLDIIKRYAETNGIKLDDCPLVKVDDYLLTEREVHSVTIGKYIGDKQEINMNIKFESNE